ncbi:DUF4386 domain-containing protein [Parasphingorhabdus sp.]|uniref:DUF4386 domain-containing protein n=1 Tax=Parasphingorhabdus sp. TaxID=2709688 RepID=UPI00326561F5
MIDQNVSNPLEPKFIARIVGGSLLAAIFVGMISALTVGEGIDINLSADVVATAQNILEAETQLRAKAYITLLTFGLSVVVGIGLYLLLRASGPLLAGWSLIVSLGAAMLVLMSAVFNLNAAEIAGDLAYSEMAVEKQRLLLAGLQATSEYTSFHLSLVLSSVSNAGFFYLFLRSGLIPKLIAGWGVFAFLFVATMIVGRDFIPALGHNYVTMAFMISNMIALFSAAFYLIIKGVRIL